MVTDQTETIRQLSERIATLETNYSSMRTQLNSIEEKLDSLLDLKAKGMGAFWLVSLVIGSGVLGLVALVINFFSNRPHL